MRATAVIVFLLLLPLGLPAGVDDRDFSGIWSLDSQLSNLHGVTAGPVLTIRRDGKTFFCGEGGAAWSFRTDGSESRYQIDESRMTTEAKWEGSALLINTLAGGPRNYVIEDRWELSGHGSRLTITRTIRRGTVATEAVLIYRSQEPSEPPVSAEIIVKPGTKIPLSLVNSLNTKFTAEGDRVYLETAFPVIQNGHIIIPKGSYVAGTVTEVKRAGRMKGKAELFLRFDSLTLPNGVTREFRSRLDSADGKDVDRQEGKITGDSNKSGDARTVGKTTGAGASVGAIAGSIAGHGVMGAGVGAAGGAVAGLAGVMLSRGPDVVLPKGTTLEMVLDRELRYDPRELESKR